MLHSDAPFPLLACMMMKLTAVKSQYLAYLLLAFVIALYLFMEQPDFS